MFSIKFNLTVNGLFENMNNDKKCIVCNIVSINEENFHGKYCRGDCRRDFRGVLSPLFNRTTLRSDQKLRWKNNFDDTLERANEYKRLKTCWIEGWSQLKLLVYIPNIMFMRNSSARIEKKIFVLDNPSRVIRQKLCIFRFYKILSRRYIRFCISK